MAWSVLHVGPRTEKKVAAVCGRHAIECYLPLRESVKVYQRRKVISQKPLFPGYVFANITQETRIHLLRTNHVLQTMQPHHEEQLLYELSQIRLALSVDPRLSSSPALSTGSHVRITAGVFAGLEGYVDKLAKKTTVCLHVEMVGQSVQVQVDLDYIKVLAS